MQNKILFLEDIRVYPYAIESSLDHLRQANVLGGIHAVIFGDFIKPGDDNLVEVVKERFAKSVDFPVFTIQGIGHGHINDPLPMNTPAVISVQDKKEGLFLWMCKICHYKMQKYFSISNNSLRDKKQQLIHMPW